MKDKIHWTWKRIVTTICTILGIGTLTSCYGMIEDDYEFDIYGTVTGKINGAETAIKGIAVAISKTGSDNDKITLTDSDGWFEFRELTEGTYTLTFNDIDGEKNGKFKQYTRDVTLNDDYNPKITLESAE
mgnify:CR=1 FL=1